MAYKLKIEPVVFIDIQEAIDRYNQLQKGLGRRFHASVKKQFKLLEKYPQGFAVRYHQVRCIIVDKFPYMVHYRVNDQSKEIIITADFSTSRDPDIWEERTNK
jgi:hypothetical protein